MTAYELLSCLTDRPCGVCKFRTDRGCSKWSCVFEGKTEEWIPCEERLPEEDGEYLVTDEDGYIKICDYVTGEVEYPKEDMYAGRQGWYRYIEDENALWKWDVVAWIPLPKPWKGEQNDTLYDDNTRQV